MSLLEQLHQDFCRLSTLLDQEDTRHGVGVAPMKVWSTWPCPRCSHCIRIAKAIEYVRMQWVVAGIDRE